MEFKKIRTRYAPSPTGLFHIGGARTALFNYLFAKHFGGDFIVRIEDTDVDRNTEEGMNSQLDNLTWLNLFPDESPNNPGEYGPYIQTEKLDVYKREANRLIQEGKAYYCFCSKEKLKKEREDKLINGQTPRYSGTCANLTQEEIEENLQKNKEFVIRIRIPNDVEKFKWDDLVRGIIEIPTSSMSDIVILKSDGYPTYNFAVVIDDYQMKISHVFRGEEHISNTPYQLAIKKQLGFESEILYGHLSIIVGEDGKKLSKRDANLDQFIDNYRSRGFLPQALINFLALLGWTPPDNQEIFSLDKMIEQFDCNSLNKTPAFFDIKKLEWVSSEYIKKMSDPIYLSFVETYLNENIKLDTNVKDEILLMFKDQLFCGSQINKYIEKIFPERLAREKLSEKNILFLNENNHLNVLHKFLAEIDLIKDWDKQNIRNVLNQMNKNLKVSGRHLYMPIRIALTNLEHGPEIDKIIYVLGREKCKLYTEDLLFFLRKTKK